MYKAHVFICTNSPDRTGKCGNLNSELLKKKVKDQCKEKFGKEVRVSSSGCLGKCEHGIATVIYPQNKWLLGLNSEEDFLLTTEVENSIK